MIKIATFNLFNYIEPPYACYDFDRIYSQEQWQKKQKWIQTYISQYQPDIIGFQEVFSPDSLKELLRLAGYPYFAVVDTAKLMESTSSTMNNDYIYHSPVVAIASRFPITKCCAVDVNKESAVAMGLTQDFSFSRQPIRATITLPSIGDTDCYVVHLKSKRPLIENEVLSFPTTNDVLSAFRQQMCGSWASAILRGSESALLLDAMIQRRQQTQYPMILMGDFNDSINNSTLEHLLMDSLRFCSDIQAQNIVQQFSLRDSWALYDNNIYGKGDKSNADDTQSSIRPATHYFGNKGSVLDYILLSCEFDTQYSHSSYSVTDYTTYDRHLINPNFEQDSESTDHAIIQITLTLRN